VHFTHGRLLLYLREYRIYNHQLEKVNILWLIGQKIAQLTTKRDILTASSSYPELRFFYGSAFTGAQALGNAGMGGIGVKPGVRPFIRFR
jgi:hypothetical protein